jgi:hypothetical protein
MRHSAPPLARRKRSILHRPLARSSGRVNLGDKPRHVIRQAPHVPCSFEIP